MTRNIALQRALSAALVAVCAAAASAQQSAVTPETKARILQAWKTATILRWSPELPLGVHYVSVPLTSNPYADAENFIALVPAGVLAPTAPRKDPNQADYFIVEKVGGLGGRPMFSGPVEMPRDPSGVTDETKARIMAAVKAHGPIEWSPRMPLGIQYVEVALTHNDSVDAQNLIALVPIGVVAPGGQRRDPNQASYFLLKKVGGLSGATLFSGPISLVGAANAPSTVPAQPGPYMERSAEAIRASGMELQNAFSR